MAARERSVSIRFPPDLLLALKQLAGLDARSLNSEVVWVLRQFVAQRDEQQQQQQRGGALYAGTFDGHPGR